MHELFPEGGVIAFTSFGHGFGRSFTKKKFLERVKNPRFIPLSTGDIFRRKIEEMGYTDLNEALDLGRKEILQLDISVDNEVYKRIREFVEEGNIVVIDSNLHGWPETLADVPSITFLVYAPSRVVGERVFRNKRAGERRYTSPEEAWEEQVRRTRKDIARYTFLSTRAPGFLRRVYLIGARYMKKLHFIYHFWLKDGLPHRTTLNLLIPPGLYLLDNSGDITNTIRQVESVLPRETFKR